MTARPSSRAREASAVSAAAKISARFRYGKSASAEMAWRMNAFWSAVRSTSMTFKGRSKRKEVSSKSPRRTDCRSTPISSQSMQSSNQCFAGGPRPRVNAVTSSYRSRSISVRYNRIPSRQRHAVGYGPSMRRRFSIESESWRPQSTERRGLTSRGFASSRPW